ncbi:hypothetical protein [Tsukamurella sp. USMM236]|uniref:hypothetical protein n=1 Tax=Tsukamurella sp. USMM236 TaxID=3081301 RepID=UPI0030192380
MTMTPTAGRFRIGEHENSTCAVTFEAVSDGLYQAFTDGRRVGDVQVSVDLRTSTTEIIDRIPPDAATDAAVIVIIAACRAVAEHQATRRLTIAVADRHMSAAPALETLGFASEGPTWPTLGDESTPRASWTRFLDG